VEPVHGDVLVVKGLLDVGQVEVARIRHLDVKAWRGVGMAWSWHGVVVQPSKKGFANIWV
jgi:hypothetical protein